MLSEENQLKYKNRLSRLLELVDIDAPPQLVAEEALLLCEAVHGGLQPLIWKLQQQNLERLAHELQKEITPYAEGAHVGIAGSNLVVYVKRHADKKEVPQQFKGVTVEVEFTGKFIPANAG